MCTDRHMLAMPVYGKLLLDKLLTPVRVKGVEYRAKGSGTQSKGEWLTEQRGVAKRVVYKFLAIEKQ